MVVPGAFESYENPAVKNKVENSENFRRRKSDRQQTTIHHNSTTNSPSKNHAKTPAFPKTPCKNTTSPRQKKTL
jgi:hypothetical protein